MTDMRGTGTLRTSQSLGQEAERQAAAYLTRQGLRLLARNYRCRMGEIDLIMQDRDSVVFVEVRYRRTDRYGSGAETVSAHKQQRLAKTALHFLKANRRFRHCATRFDVVSICGDIADLRFDWIRNALEY